MYFQQFRFLYFHQISLAKVVYIYTHEFLLSNRLCRSGPITAKPRGLPVSEEEERVEVPRLFPSSESPSHANTNWKVTEPFFMTTHVRTTPELKLKKTKI